MMRANMYPWRKLYAPSQIIYLHDPTWWSNSLKNEVPTIKKFLGVCPEPTQYCQAKPGLIFYPPYVLPRLAFDDKNVRRIPQLSQGRKPRLPLNLAIEIHLHPKQVLSFQTLTHPNQNDPPRGLPT